MRRQHNKSQDAAISIRGQSTAMSSRSAERPSNFKIRTQLSSSVDGASYRFRVREGDRPATMKEMVWKGKKPFHEYQTPKVGLEKRKVYLPMKLEKRGGFIDDVIVGAKITPGSDKYNPHKTWDGVSKFLKFSQRKKVMSCLTSRKPVWKM